MQGGFTKGLIIGSIVGVSISMMMDGKSMSGRSRKRMMKNGRNVLRKSGTLISDVVDLLR